MILYGVVGRSYLSDIGVDNIRILNSKYLGDYPWDTKKKTDWDTLVLILVLFSKKF